MCFGASKSTQSPNIPPSIDQVSPSQELLEGLGPLPNICGPGSLTKSCLCRRREKKKLGRKNAVSHPLGDFGSITHHFQWLTSDKSSYTISLTISIIYKIYIISLLVGGFNSSEKYESQLG